MAEAVKVQRIETFIVDLPTIRPHQLAMATMRQQVLMIVRLHMSDGTVGIGEGTTIGGLAYGAESPEGMKLAIDTYMAPILLACDANRVARTMATIGTSVQGNHFAKCAVETALLDALGQRVGLPISELLGGRQHDRLPVAWTLASGDTERDITEAEEMLARRRHNIFKLKIGKGDPRANVAHVAAIKRALGTRASVRVDINQAWSEATASAMLPLLAEAGVDLIEQPVALRNVAGLARLARETPVAIMADEALYGPDTAFVLAAQAAADVFALKIEQSGGLFAAAKVAAIAEAAGIGLYGGTMLEAGVGTAASAHLFSTLGRLEWGTELFGPLLLTEEILETPLDYSDFGLAVPTGPGLGVTLSERQLARFRRDRAERSLHVVSTAGQAG
ncbi:muconate/chloromuconate family cycloisomerase [Aquabacter sp. P-9]|uniref:muconate/chloromuconate family cycloisomerase n=1 Tax=Aquabacter sediminis TaxID=3029197 RepID=UPI00237E4635|nr:muconate/chloromuconate family cycloisomerase [Aquabacter sp. P-9]MDE1569525.1 muconate/chloromuconate family cycloisomerase [Aquabacter sp. P-9]